MTYVHTTRRATLLLALLTVCFSAHSVFLYSLVRKFSSPINLRLSHSQKAPRQITFGETPEGKDKSAPPLP